MRILGEEVAGGDMALLDKMFEKGEIETSKYLPIVLSRMKKESDKLMGAYYESLPYATAEASRQREKWMREFAEGGAEKGILRFWEAWGAFVKESRTWAPQLGEIFGKISWEFSRFFLISNEFKRWASQGETDIRNYFQQTFGNFDESTFSPLKNSWNDLVDSVLRTVEKINGGVKTLRGENESEGFLKSMLWTLSEAGSNIFDIATIAIEGGWGDPDNAEQARIRKKSRDQAYAEWREYGKDSGVSQIAFISERLPAILEGNLYDQESKEALGYFLKSAGEEIEEAKSLLDSILDFRKKQNEEYKIRYENWKLNKESPNVVTPQSEGDKEGSSWFWNPELYPQNIPEQTLNNNSYSQHTHDYKSNITINVSSVGTTEEQAMVISNAITKELGQWEQGMLQKVTVNIPEVTS